VTLRLVPRPEGPVEPPAPTVPGRATAGLDLDLATRTAVIRLKANDTVLRAMETGLAAVRRGEVLGYFLQVGVTGEPGTFTLTVERVEVAPEAARVPEDYEDYGSHMTPPDPSG